MTKGNISSVNYDGMIKLRQNYVTKGNILFVNHDGTTRAITPPPSFPGCEWVYIHNKPDQVIVHRCIVSVNKQR